MADELGRIVESLSPELGEPEGSPDRSTAGSPTATTAYFSAGAATASMRLPGKDTELLGIDREDRACGPTRRRRRSACTPEVVAFLPGSPPCLVTAFIESAPGAARRSCVRASAEVAGGAEGRSTLRRACRGASTPSASSSSTARPRGRAAARSRPPTTRPREPRKIEAALTGPEHEPVPCHNDLLPANFIDDGGAAADPRLGVRRHGRPLLRPRQPRRSTTASTRPTTSALLAAYFGEPAHAAALRRAAADADHVGLPRGDVGRRAERVSELDFDFVAYADEHLGRVRAPRPTRASSAGSRRRVWPTAELPAAARCVIIGGGVGGSLDRLPPGRARLARRRAGRPQPAHQRLDVPLRGPRRPAARLGLADEDDDVLGRALPEARRGRVRPRLDRVRRHPAGLLARALGGDAPPGRLGEDVRAAARADLRRRRRRSVPADGHRRRARRVVAADRRLPRPEPAHLRARRRRPPRRLPDLHQHARDRHRRRPTAACGACAPSAGDIEAEVVVNAGGMFAAEIGRLAGVRVPIVPMAHEYVVTQPFRERGERPPADAARPRPPHLLPRGGRRARDGRLRAPPRARVPADGPRARRRSRPTSTAACSRRTGTASRRSSSTPSGACPRWRTSRHAADQRAGGVHARRRVLPRRDRGARASSSPPASAPTGWRARAASAR